MIQTTLTKTLSTTVDPNELSYNMNFGAYVDDGYSEVDPLTEPAPKGIFTLFYKGKLILQAVFPPGGDKPNRMTIELNESFFEDQTVNPSE